MRSIYKYLAHAGFIAAVCIFSAVPAMAQHRGGGGGFSGGGHAGGGFSGGGHFSAPAARPSFTPRTSYNPRTNYRPGMNYGSRSAITAGRTGVVARRGYYGGRIGFGANSRATVMAHRGYVSGGVGAEVYGHGGRYGAYGWGRHGGYFYNRGYFGSLYYPWLGLSYDYLPWGYYPFWWDDAMFYYSGGLFYQYDNDQYTVVEPPVGAAVNSLPDDAQSIVINGEQYYEYKGVYYQPVTRDDGSVVYQVAGKDGELNTTPQGATAVVPQVGDFVYQLPQDCRKIKLNGETYYVSVDGIYYQKTRDNNNKKAYKIVALDNDGQQ